VGDFGGRRFRLQDHPRLADVCRSPEPVLFPGECSLPDPYDGLVEGVPSLNQVVHSCLGCPLRVDGELVGVMTVDALEPGVFEGVSREFLLYLGALAGAALRTSDMIQALEDRAQREGQLAADVVREVHQRRGGLLLGRGTSMTQLRSNIELVAGSEFPVLVTGETGTGKELIVRMVHAHSARAERPLVYLNCAALPESVAESELFGHAKGAFTGADVTRPGKFSVADGASLLLDEVGELPLHIQPKLLRALQEGEIQRVGEDRPLHVDVRVLASTNRDLEVEVAAGRFRADLLHRLDVCRIQAPALRDHREDIPELAGYAADQVRCRLGTGPIRFSTSAQTILAEADWPGNVRELENVVARAVLHASSRVVRGETVMVRAADLSGSLVQPREQRVADVEPTSSAAAPERMTLRESVEDHQRSRITRAVERSGGNWSAAARELGMHRSNLHHLTKRLGLR
jgi:anaerobic nitric oxide reductase transcription regulator